jgi:hypothetical protein
VNQAPHPYYYNIPPGSFATMQTRLVAGRDIDELDRTGTTPAAVINQALARRLFPNEDALGKRFHQGPNSSDWVQIVGIVQDGKYESLNDEFDQLYSGPPRSGTVRSQPLSRGHHCRLRMSSAGSGKQFCHSIRHSHFFRRAASRNI